MRWRSSLVFAIAALLCVAFRVVPGWLEVFPPGRPVRLLDTDSYFHVRHARRLMGTFPRLDRHDAMTAYPRGEKSDAVGLYDWALAGVARALGGTVTQPAPLEEVGATAPVALALASLLALFALARTWLRPGLAAWVVACHVVYPGEGLARTVLGAADHHAIEIFLALTAALGFVRALRSRRSGLAAWTWTALHALPMVIFIFTWVGAPLMLGPLAAGVVLETVALVALGRSTRRVRRGASRFALAVLVLTWTLVTVFPALLMSQAAFRTGTLALALIALGPLSFGSLADLLERRGWSVRGRTLALVWSALVLVTATLVSNPRLSRIVTTIFEAKSGIVVEHVPVDLGRLWYLSGLASLLALTAALEILSSLIPGRLHRVRHLAPLGVTALLTLLWVRSHDYGYMIPPFLALMGGLGLGALLDGRTPAVRLAVLGVALLAPFTGGGQAKPWLSAFAVRSLIWKDQAWEEATDWLRSATPRPGVTERPYGVLTAWDCGNFVNTLGERPTVWSRYPQKESALWFMATDEAEAMRLACPDCGPEGQVRYVVLHGRSLAQCFTVWAQLSGIGTATLLDTTGTLTFEGRQYRPATYGAPYYSAVSVRLYYSDGQGLSHHRLVHETSHRSRHQYVHTMSDAGVQRTAIPVGEGTARAGGPAAGVTRVVATGNTLTYDESEHATIKTFEIVAGARLQGRAPPGATVTASLPLVVPSTGRPFTYSNTAVVGPGGSWQLVVPHASRSPENWAGCRAAAPYRIELQGEPGGARVGKLVDVPDEAVTAGLVVTVPDIAGLEFLRR